MMYSYFLLDTVERKKLIRAINDLIRRSDELWVFGRISSGVREEINLADSLKLPVRYFKFNRDKTACSEVQENDLVIEEKESL